MNKSVINKNFRKTYHMKLNSMIYQLNRKNVQVEKMDSFYFEKKIKFLKLIVEKMADIPEELVRVVIFCPFINITYRFLECDPSFSFSYKIEKFQNLFITSNTINNLEILYETETDSLDFLNINQMLKSIDKTKISIYNDIQNSLKTQRPYYDYDF